MENNKKEVLYVSGTLGGYPGLEASQEFTLYAKLYNEGYTHVQDGDESALWVSKNPLPTFEEVAYYGLTVNHEDVVASLEALGYEVTDLEEDRPDLVPEPNQTQLSYKR